MPYRRALILANSVYQLLTAVHLRRALLEGAEADLLVTDVTPGLDGCLPRLRETGLFRRVLFAAAGEVNRLYPAAREEAVAEAFQNILPLLRGALSDELDEYDQVYFANFDLFTRLLAYWYYTRPCEFIGYEDGFSSYVIDFLREDRAAVNRHPDGRKIQDKVSRILLYEPRLAMRGDRLPNVPLPKISRDDPALREVLNYIFDYHPPEQEAGFLFLEQSFRAEGIAANDIALMQECRDAVAPGRFLVKPHPRNPENLPCRLGLTRPYRSSAPWELTLLNEDTENITLLTVCSNAALTGRIVFGLDIATVMLYRLFEGKVLWKEDDVLRRYLRRFRQEFAGSRYYVPETLYQLRSLLHYLDGAGPAPAAGDGKGGGTPCGQL
ncbi:MAG TPA: alpha-2,8-polysialyltransferase family protein [Firmicutes bacterium]|nr:alpha-2,8-polysialyltransferase family protein [Bacillota bacterium]